MAKLLRIICGYGKPTPSGARSHAPPHDSLSANTYAPP